MSWLNSATLLASARRLPRVGDDMSEYSGKQSRGRMVGLVFAMQGAGARRRPAGRLAGSASQRCTAAAPCPVVLVKRDG